MHTKQNISKERHRKIEESFDQAVETFSKSCGASGSLNFLIKVLVHLMGRRGFCRILYDIRAEMALFVGGRRLEGEKYDWIITMCQQT